MSARREALRIASAGLAACDVFEATERAVVAGRRRAGRRRRPPPARPGGPGARRRRRQGLARDRRGARADPRRAPRRRARSPSGGDERGRLGRIEVLGADHPLPSESSGAAATRLLEIASGAGERDVVIACFTGGSSALASLPPAGGLARREARPARAAAVLGHRDRRGQHGPQARLGVQGRPARQGGAAGDPHQPDRLRRRRRSHRRDHRPDRPRHDPRRRRDRGPLRPRPLGPDAAVDPRAPPGTGLRVPRPRRRPDPDGPAGHRHDGLRRDGDRGRSSSA